MIPQCAIVWNDLKHFLRECNVEWVWIYVLIEDTSQDPLLQKGIDWQSNHSRKHPLSVSNLAGNFCHFR